MTRTSNDDLRAGCIPWTRSSDLQSKVEGGGHKQLLETLSPYTPNIQ